MDSLQSLSLYNKSDSMSLQPLTQIQVIVASEQIIAKGHERLTQTQVIVIKGQEIAPVITG